MTLVLNRYKQAETKVHVVGVLAREYRSTRKLIIFVEYVQESIGIKIWYDV